MCLSDISGDLRGKSWKQSWLIFKVKSAPKKFSPKIKNLAYSIKATALIPE